MKKATKGIIIMLTSIISIVIIAFLMKYNYINNNQYLFSGLWIISLFVTVFGAGEFIKNLGEYKK